MRITIFLLLSFFSVLSYASCELEMASIRTETLSLSIYDEGCANDQIVIDFATKDRESSKFESSIKVPFLSECALTKDGFKCNAKGKTPLAGATYKKVKFGRSWHDNSCGDGEPNYDAPGEKYICVKGCGKLTIPEYLIGNDGSC